MLTLPDHLLHAIAVAAEGAYPHEGCGILLGRLASGGDCTATAVLPAENVAPEERRHDRFVVSPRDLLQAQRRADAEGLAVIGFWHSHPDHPAVPSATDLAAAWEAYVYLIIPVAGGVAGVPRCWRLAGGAEAGFLELPVAS